MSAYVVSNETINKILAGLEYTKWKHMDYPRAPKSLYGKEYGPEFEPEQLAQSGRDLLALNVRAVQARYSDLAKKTATAVVAEFNLDNEAGEFVYVAGSHTPKPVELFKALQCFLYQCAEGDVPSDPLYEELNDWANSIARHIVYQSDEYEKATYG